MLAPAPSAGILWPVSRTIQADQIDTDHECNVGRFASPTFLFPPASEVRVVNRDFIGALLQLNAEKGVPQEVLIQTLEQAIESAYRRNADAPENVVVRVDPESGRIVYNIAGRETDRSDIWHVRGYASAGQPVGLIHFLERPDREPTSSHG